MENFPRRRVAVASVLAIVAASTAAVLSACSPSVDSEGITPAPVPSEGFVSSGSAGLLPPSDWSYVVDGAEITPINPPRSIGGAMGSLPLAPPAPSPRAVVSGGMGSLPDSGTEGREPKKTPAATAGKAAVKTPARLVSLTAPASPAPSPSSKAVVKAPTLGGETAAVRPPMPEPSESVQSEPTPVDCSLTSAQKSEPTKFGHIAFRSSGCDEGWVFAWFNGSATDEPAGTIVCSPLLSAPAALAPGCVVAADGVWSLVSGADLDSALSKVVTR